MVLATTALETMASTETQPLRTIHWMDCLMAVITPFCTLRRRCQAQPIDPTAKLDLHTREVNLPPRRTASTPGKEVTMSSTGARQLLIPGADKLED